MQATAYLSMCEVLSGKKETDFREELDGVFRGRADIFEDCWQQQQTQLNYERNSFSHGIKTGTLDKCTPNKKIAWQ